MAEKESNYLIKDALSILDEKFSEVKKPRPLSKPKVTGIQTKQTAKFCTQCGWAFRI